MERELREQLLASDGESRPERFRSAYSELFDRVPWHPALLEIDGPQRAEIGAKKSERFREWIGPPEKTVLELGFGAGELLLALSQIDGYTCHGIDVEPRRVSAITSLGSGGPQVTLGDASVPCLEPGTFDAVISQQLFEHLHPEDALEHLRAIKVGLKPGGCYFLETPNRLTGPSDVSRFFVDGSPEGFHLREYSVRDLVHLFREAQYASVRVILWRKRILSGPLASLVERLWAFLPRRVRRRHSLGLHNPIVAGTA